MKITLDFNYFKVRKEDVVTGFEYFTSLLKIHNIEFYYESNKDILVVSMPAKEDSKISKILADLITHNIDGFYDIGLENSL